MTGEGRDLEILPFGECWVIPQHLSVREIKLPMTYAYPFPPFTCLSHMQTAIFLLLGQFLACVWRGSCFRVAAMFIRAGVLSLLCCLTHIYAIR